MLKLLYALQYHTAEITFDHMLRLAVEGLNALQYHTADILIFVNGFIL